MDEIQGWIIALLLTFIMSALEEANGKIRGSTILLMTLFVAQIVYVGFFK